MHTVAFGGITAPAPLAPYPSSGGMISLRLPATLMLSIPSSHPPAACIHNSQAIDQKRPSDQAKGGRVYLRMTCPLPRTNSIGSPREIELSKTCPGEETCHDRISQNRRINYCPRE